MEAGGNSLSLRAGAEPAPPEEEPFGRCRGLTFPFRPVSYCNKESNQRLPPRGSWHRRQAMTEGIRSPCSIQHQVKRRRKEFPRPLYSLVFTLILTHSQKQNRVEKRCISFFPKDQKRGFWRCLPIHSEGYPQDVGLWIFGCAETKKIPKRMKSGKNYAAYAFRASRNPPVRKRIYRKLPKIPQEMWIFWTVFHNLSQSQNAGVSRASQGFPQFPQVLLLLLIIYISTSTKLTLGGRAYVEDPPLSFGMDTPKSRLEVT